MLCQGHIRGGFKWGWPLQSSHVVVLLGPQHGSNSSAAQKLKFLYEILLMLIYMEF